MSKRNGMLRIAGYEVIREVPGSLDEILRSLRSEVPGTKYTVRQVDRTLSEGWRREARPLPDVEFSSHRSEGATMVNGGWTPQDVVLIYGP